VHVASTYPDNFHYEKKPTCADHKIDTSLSAKMNGTQRRTLVSKSIVCTAVCQKATLGLKSEKNQACSRKPLSNYACLKASASQSVSQQFHQSVKLF